MKTFVKEGENDDFTMMRHGKNLADMDQAYRINYWQRLGDEAIFKRALEMIGSYCLEYGIHTKLDRKIEFHSKTLSEKQ